MQTFWGEGAYNPLAMPLVKNSVGITNFYLDAFGSQLKSLRVVIILRFDYSNFLPGQWTRLIKTRDNLMYRVGHGNRDKNRQT